MAQKLKAMMQQLSQFLDQQKSTVPEETWKSMLQIYVGSIAEDHTDRRHGVEPCYHREVVASFKVSALGSLNPKP